METAAGSLTAASQYEKWMAPGCTPDKLIDAARRPKKQQHSRSRNFHLAQKTIEAATPVLQKFGQGIITNVGDVPCFLLITMDTAAATNNNVQCSLNVVRPVENRPSFEAQAHTETQTRADANAADTAYEGSLALICSGEQAKDLAAAFILDFPDANFLYVNTTGEPKRLFLLSHDRAKTKMQLPAGKKSSSSPMTFRYVQSLLEKQIYQFHVGCEE